MATTATLGGLSLNTGNYTLSEGLDWGGNDLAATLLTGDLRAEEYDQYLAELRYTRQVSIPINLRSGTFAQSIADSQAITSKLAAASRYSTIDFVFTPNGGNASTFKVIGGSLEWQSTNQQVNLGTIRSGTLVLDCLPWCYGAAQALGSSGAPLATNTASPAAVTLTPSPAGDVPGDVTLFVKNRSASAIRSLYAAGIGGNTTWVANSVASGWTLDAAGLLSGGLVVTNNPLTPGTVNALAHFTAPSLPNDRPVRVYLRASQTLVTNGEIKTRIRIVSGAVEMIGPWRAIPQEVQNNTASNQIGTLMDMGSYYFPAGRVGQLGSGSVTTTINVEAMSVINRSSGVSIKDALFMPADGALLVETSDTSKTIAAASGVVRIESDQAYADTTGNPLGGAVTGSHIRTTGGRYYVYASQGYQGTLDTTLPYAPENVDVWASYTPRYIHLA